MRYNYFIRSAVIYCAGICLSTAVFINTSAAQTIDEAKALFNAKNYTQAETILKAILKKNRNEPQANLYLGKIYRIQKQYDLAEQYLKKAVDKDKKLADGFYELGQIQLDKPRGLFGTKYKEAQNWFLKAVKADPKNADAKFALYETYFTLDESKKAFDVLSEYVKENPNSTRGLLELARLWKYCEYNMLRRLGTVHDIYLQAFATDPENPEDLFEIGWGLFLCDDLRNARLAHSRAEYVSKEITAEQYLDMMVVAFENLDYGTAYDYLTKAFAKLSGENRKLLTDPKRVPDFLLNELYNTYNIKVEQFLNPSYVPADQKLYIKQLYHFATLWTINHSDIERAKPLNYTGNHRFDTPYLLFGGLHNYLDYSFYYFLSSTEANEFLSIPNQYERAEWRHRWFREHDTSPTNDVNELEEEFMNRVNYVHEEFKILPNKYNKEWHANEQIGFDDRGKVWLKYGKPYHSYPDFGGFVDKETMDNPLLPQTKYTVTSGYKQVQVKPNESWVYPHLDGYLAFDFIEINVGYFTYSETLEDAVLGGTGAGRLYLNPLRVDLGGPYLVLYERYHDLLQKIDTRDESLWNLDETTYNEMITRGLGDKTKKFEFVQSDFLYDDLLPEIIKRNEVMEEYPTNLIDLGKPRFRLPMFVDMASFKGESGSTKIEVYTAVDYRNLSFAKESDKKRLAYLEYSVVVKDKDIMPVTRDTSFNQIVAEPKDLTRDNSWINWFTFNLTPQEYRIYVNGKNFQGKKESVIELQPIVLQNYNVDTLAVSDIQLSLDIKPSSERNTFVKNELSVIPYPYRVIDHKKPISLYYEIYNLGQRLDGSTSYDVNLLFTVYEPNNNLRDALKNLFPGRTAKVEISFKESRIGTTRDAIEFRSLDVNAVMPGNARIKLEITDNLTKQKTYKTLDVIIY